MADVSVALMEAKDEGEYEALIASAAASPLTHTLAYRDVLLGCGLGTPKYLLAREGSRLCAALPAFVQRSPLGAVLNSLPLVQSAGGVVFAHDLSPDQRTSLAEALLVAVNRLALTQAINVCVVVGTPYDHAQPSATAPDFFLARNTHVLDLRQSLQLHHGAKEALRKACQANPVHRVAETIEQAKLVWELYAQNMNRIGVVPRAWLFYEQLFRHAGDHVRFVWAEVGGEMACGLVLLSHRDVVDYHSVGNTQQGRRKQIATWLCVQELKHAQARGAVWWNWGVSPTPAVAAFKAGFGGSDRPYPISGFVTGDVQAWKALPPAALAQHFPDYFVLPYDWLAQDSA